jgi:hypothetical protein
MPSNTLAQFRRLLPDEQRSYARHVGHYIGCAIYPDAESHFYQVGDFYVAFTMTRSQKAVNTTFRSGPEFDRMLSGIRLNLAALGLVSGSR